MVKFFIGLAAGWFIGVLHMCLADLVDGIDDLAKMPDEYIEPEQETEEHTEEEPEPYTEEETNLYDNWYEMDWGWEDV